MTPQFPIISVYNDGIEIFEDESHLASATVLAVLKGEKDSKAYDGNGKKWNYKLVSSKVKDNFLTRVLANTVYNPIVKVHPKWSKSSDFDIHELKTIVQHCIDNDDDVLTQFVDAKTLKQHIANSPAFEDVYNVLKKYSFEVDEDELFGNKE
ncbi:hypothetical protein [Sanyastnella coralliicola]|uniref:hypothetical protein n=1 Tax=Sanyastnella coralliicola TaxID=3069118 RepID=UPI0027B8AC63|nr:hypothetical protein [Longitalea sp. SCSIO 12813]